MNNLSGVAIAGTAVLFGASAIAFGVTVVTAVRTDDTPLPQVALEASTLGAEVDQESQSVGGEEGRGAPTLRTRGITYPLATDDEILDAVNQDLFQPDRTPPVDRYMLPNERPSEEPTRNTRRQPDPNLQIVGIAIADNLALAMVQPDDSLPFSVLVGETVNGFLVSAISEEMVTLTRGDWELYLPVMEASRRSSSRNDRGDNREQAVTEEAARALSERILQMQQAVQRGGRGQMMRGGGGVPLVETDPRFVPAPRIFVPANNGGGGSGGGEREEGGGSQ